MSRKYKATTTEEAYFITITAVGWIDIFTRLNQKHVITNALKHCQEHKGLEIYARSPKSSLKTKRYKKSEVLCEVSRLRTRCSGFVHVR